MRKAKRRNPAARFASNLKKQQLKQKQQKLKLILSLDDAIAEHRYGIITPDSLALVNAMVFCRALLIARPVGKPKVKK